MILSFLTGIGILLFGVNIMSSSFETLSGNKIRQSISKFNKNIYKSAGFGFVLDLLFQSSTATVSLTMGLCEAEIITLLQAVCMIFGSNVGSAINLFWVAFQEINIIGYFGLLTLIGVFIRLFIKNKTAKNWGMCLCGFGLLFIGLATMSSSAKALCQTEQFINFFTNFNTPILMFLIGLVLSAVINSSLGSTAILVSIISMSPNIFTLQNVAYYIYAINVGTCFTLILIGLASKNKKSIKASLSYLLFNLIGTAIFGLITIFDWITPLTSFINNVTIQIIFINIIFNVVTLLITLPFAKYITKFLDKIIKEKQIQIENKISPMVTLGFAQLNNLCLDNLKSTHTNILNSIQYVKNSQSQIELTKNDIQNIIEKTKEYNDSLFKIEGELSSGDIKLKQNLSHIFIGIEKVNVNALKLINSTYYNNKRVTFYDDQINIINKMEKSMKNNLNNIFILIEEYINTGKLENKELPPKIIKSLEKITKINLKTKKEIANINLNTNNKVQKYSCFLNILNYFEEITNDLTDIILNIMRPIQD